MSNPRNAHSTFTSASIFHKPNTPKPHDVRPILPQLASGLDPLAKVDDKDTRANDPTLRQLIELVQETRSAVHEQQGALEWIIKVLGALPENLANQINSKGSVNSTVSPVEADAYGISIQKCGL
jgi:hypothetical protein